MPASQPITPSTPQPAAAADTVTTVTGRKAQTHSPREAAKPVASVTRARSGSGHPQSEQTAGQDARPAAAQPAAYRACRHIHENGAYCRQPAVQKRKFCYQHLRARGRQMRMAREGLKLRGRALVLPPLEDFVAIQQAIQMVLTALAFERVDQRYARTMLYGINQVSDNLKFQQKMQARLPQQPPAEYAVEYPGFERDFDLPEDADLETPPEIVFSETLAADAPRPEPSPYRAGQRWPQVGPEDIELDEIFRNQGPEAYDRRRRELNQKAMKQAMDYKREVQHAKWVVEADRRNLEAILGTPEEQARLKEQLEQDRELNRALCEARRKNAESVGLEAAEAKKA